jgi:hypothetical protein
MKFSLLWMLTGSPVSAGLILLAFYAVTDWYTFGFLRGVARAVNDWSRGRKLEHLLLVNPHDRRARADLGEILVSQRRWAKVLEVVTPVAHADPHDKQALLLLGIACLRSGRLEQGELFLGEVDSAERGFRGGAALLELGRSRLDRKDPRARETLLDYCKLFPHSVEGHCLLSAAHGAAGDAAAAKASRERCWLEHVTSLPYQKRMNRLWAWRANPGRPVLYAAVLLAVVGLFAVAAQNAGPGQWSRRPHAAQAASD